MATPAVDSATLLSPECKAFRIKVIAHLMAHKGLDSLDKVKSRLAEEMEYCSERLYTADYTPSDISVDNHHLYSWKDIVWHSMSEDDQKEFDELKRLFPRPTPDSNGPRSPEYEAHYETTEARREQNRAEVVNKVTALYNEFEVLERGLDPYTDHAKKNELFGRALMGISMAIGEDKILDKEHLASLIVHIWELGGMGEHHLAAEEWCDLHGHSYGLLSTLGGGSDSQDDDSSDTQDDDSS